MRLIHQIVRETERHPTADWIFEEARQKMPRISLGTVYRNLNQLEDEGLIRSITEDNLKRYDGNLMPHQHLKCKSCGKVIDVDIPDAYLKSKINKNFQFDVDKVEMVFFGTCSDHN